MVFGNSRSLLIAAIIVCNCITWTSSRHHFNHNILRHRSRHRRQGAGLYLASSYVLPGGEGGGAWGEWGDVSPCSRSCGGGVASQTRICLLVGSDGQPRCTGGATKYFSCQTQDCPEGSRDFRTEQCAEYNSVSFKGVNYDWLPYTKAPNPCELNCRPRGERFYFRQNKQVVDGTRCNEDSFDVCVNGTCQPVGCDMMLGSNAKEDKCRECRGNGTNCHTVSGILDSQDLVQGYNDVLLIPKGATSIFISEVRASNNYLALRSKNYKNYYLNGDYHIDFPRSITIAGALWQYERSQQGFAAPDRLKCLGPTNEPLYLSLLLQETNVGIQYEYSIPREMAPATDQLYNWVYDEYTPCSATCGGGIQFRNVTCRSREELEVVDSSLCDQGLKPVFNKTCSNQPCAPRWVQGPWSPCSKPCGEGGSRSRAVYCERIISNRQASIVDDSECFGTLGPKPELYQECNKASMCPTWFTGPWQPCDKLCGEGTQKRQVVCHQRVDGRVKVYPDENCAEEKPETSRSCMEYPCEGVDWVLSDWSGCDNCLSKVRTRQAVCATKDRTVVDAKFCANHPKPNLQEDCDRAELPPCTVQWYATQWSNCSVECGNGVQTRRLFCGQFDGVSVVKVDDSRCEEDDKYNDTKPCNVPDEKCPAKWFGGPWSECTKQCGGGEQTRHTMCLKGSLEATTCNPDEVIESTQACNTGPCNEDEVIPVDSKTTPIMDDDYYVDEDCLDEEYPEEGLDIVPDDIYTKMFSDSPSTDITEEGSGMGTTDFTSDITDEGSGFESTTEIVSSSESSEPTESVSTVVTSSTDTTESSTESLSTANATDSSDVTETASSSESISTDTATEQTSEASGSTEFTASTESSGSTESSVSTESSGSTESSSSTESNEPTETSGSTESSASTETSGSTETTESSSSTETSSSTDSSVSTESSSVTDSTSDYTSSGSDITDTTSSTDFTSVSDLSSTTREATSYYTDTSDTSESSTETVTESSSTSTDTDSTEDTSSSITDNTTSTETDISSTTEETGSTSEGSTVTEESEGSTVTEESQGSTITEESEGSTVTEESEGSTVTEETGSTVTEETETTESGATEATSESEATSEMSSTELDEETTPWDWSSTVEFYTKRPGCKRRRKSKCIKTKFGCCPDRRTAAAGPFDEGCLKPETCKESLHGCCPDGLSPAQGPNDEDCPVPPCKETLYGCCKSDNKTPAEGNDQEGCPPPQPKCKSSKFGCCADEKTQAKGPHKKGCPEKESKKKPKDCTSSEHGCCYDNKTAASGPNGEGCPCTATEFGCCPDQVTAALGSDLEGCVLNCNASAHGCCPDGETPAHGPDAEGCCLLYPFGCCPDNYNAAQGPQLQGCVCQTARYGCCPDNVTIARGANNEGCGCEYAQNGCCPDKHTEATGPNHEGCGCHTYQFGCCPDGVTVAKGPNLYGCHCQQSQYGCCSDGQTPAQGPGSAGCDCSASKYGCCPDGETEAKGEKFLGCENIPVNRQAACGLKTDRGPCRNYTVNWYYDIEYGGCSRFWYGGCEGNGNRFSSAEECQDVCVHPNPKDACKLPQSKGACQGYHLHWYFDNNRQQCGQFVYGGCLGNDNNFETREACQKQCEPARSGDQCKLPLERGSCAGNFSRWGFSVESGRCEQFIWGGCEGNNNRFESEAACIHRCDQPGTLKEECKLPQEKGNCTEKQARWAFSETENRCVPFYYTGCNGNENNFVYEEDCNSRCPSVYEQETCLLPAETGACAEYREKWYYDTAESRCRQFYYGGCGGNGNNFHTEQECEQRCKSQQTTTTAAPVAHQQFRPEFCFLQEDRGPCRNSETRWVYDTSSGECRTFQYGGCGGNRNNFPSQEHCQYYCIQAQDACQLPMSTGPCEDSIMSWFYDAATDRCSQFTYSGCGGNINRFNSLNECERRCKTAPQVVATLATTTSAQDPSPQECRSAQETCTSAGQVWYLESGECVPHYNQLSGSDCRHTNTFPSQEACERNCGSFRGLEVCRYGVEAGECSEYVTKYFFNETALVCQTFTYGGCLGGPNRFSTLEECETTCKPYSSDACSQSYDEGSCKGYQIKWYYDQERRQCGQFVYTGCGGNDNRFDSNEQCERQCNNGRPQPEPQVEVDLRGPEVEQECRTPASLSACGSNVTAYYYDEMTGDCLAGVAGGCQHLNSYTSEEECQRRCGRFRGLDVCQYHMDPGPCPKNIPKYFYEKATGSCQMFAYGGCEGSPNRFSTVEECESVCASEGRAAVCLLGVSTGSADCREVSSRRWHYSSLDEDCLAFVYTGCGGNENNFHSYRDCLTVCNPDEPNEVNECDSYTEECARLRCAYGVQRVRTATGCDRCACADAREQQCRALIQECDDINCPFGVQKTVQADGCERCTCKEHLCTRVTCPEGQRCTLEPYRDEQTSETKYRSECKTVNKTGECPSAQEPRSDESCRLECNDDADCRGDGKCCSRGCSRLCVPPAATAPQYPTTVPTTDNLCARVSCPDNQRCVLDAYRDPVTLETRYNPDCRTVNKEGHCPLNDGRSDESCRLECNDDADCRGDGKCCSRGCSRLCVPPAAGATTPFAPSTVHVPELPQAPQANPATEPEVTSQEDGKATLRCLFHGNPPPKITWQHGKVTIDGTVGRYRLLSDGALEIVSLYRNDSGVYICVADNGLGTARQEVRLQVNDPVESPASIAGDAGDSVTAELGQSLELRCLAYGHPTPSIAWYRGVTGPMVPYVSRQYEARGNVLQIRVLDLETIGEYACQAYNGLGKPTSWSVVVQAYRPDGELASSPFLVSREGEVRVTPRPPTPPPIPPFTPYSPTTPDTPIYSVPVSTRLGPTQSSYPAGSDLTIPCEVDGYPIPEVYWSKDNVRLYNTDRIQVSDARLTISGITPSDTGVYGCHATNSVSSQEATVQINVEGLYIPPSCIDNPFFANCALIVTGKYCHHPYYSSFCCKSCVTAGQISIEEIQAIRRNNRK